MKLRDKRFLARLLGSALALVTTPLFALDHDNLDPNRPIGMEDAYAIPKGEIGLEGGVRFNAVSYTHLTLPTSDLV